MHDRAAMRCIQEGRTPPSWQLDEGGKQYEPLDRPLLPQTWRPRHVETASRLC